MRIVRTDDVDEPFRGPLGELIYEMIGRPQNLGGTTAHSFVHVILPPGKSSRPHFHKVAEETYYGLSGAGHMTVGSESAVLRPGDACLIMPGEIHHIVNRGDDQLEFITVSAPAWTPDDSYYPDV